MKTHKKLIIIAAALVGLGLMVSGTALAMVGFDFSKLGTEMMADKEYRISDSFRYISIDADTEDILFRRATDGKCRVVCFESEERPHIVEVKSGTLTIERKSDSIFHFGFVTQRPKITVYLPEGTYDSIRIDTDTGDTIMEDVECKNVYFTADTGDLQMKNVIASGDFKIELDTGDVNFDRSDANQIFVETDTGDISGTLLTNKVFFAQTDTGDVDVPRTISGGRCELTTDTGDISIRID